MSADILHPAQMAAAAANVYSPPVPSAPAQYYNICFSGHIWSPPFLKHYVPMYLTIGLLFMLAFRCFSRNQKLECGACVLMSVVFFIYRWCDNFGWCLYDQYGMTDNMWNFFTTFCGLQVATACLCRLFCQDSKFALTMIGACVMRECCIFFILGKSNFLVDLVAYCVPLALLLENRYRTLNNDWEAVKQDVIKRLTQNEDLKNAGKFALLGLFLEMLANNHMSQYFGMLWIFDFDNCDLPAGDGKHPHTESPFWWIYTSMSAMCFAYAGDLVLVSCWRVMRNAQHNDDFGMRNNDFGMGSGADKFGDSEWEKEERQTLDAAMQGYGIYGA